MLTDPTQFLFLTDTDPEMLAKWTQKAETRLDASLSQRGGSLAAAWAAKPAYVQEVVENAVIRVLRPNDAGLSLIDDSTAVWFPDNDLDILAVSLPKVRTVWVG